MWAKQYVQWNNKFSPSIRERELSKYKCKINTGSECNTTAMKIYPQKGMWDLKPAAHSQECYKLYIWQLALTKHRKMVDLGKKKLFPDTENFIKRFMLRFTGNF